jgi:hypothetical protein
MGAVLMNGVVVGAQSIIGTRIADGGIRSAARVVGVRITGQSGQPGSEKADDD